MDGRRKASIRNIAIALVSEVLVTIVGFLFPKAIIVNYGSPANGLITSLQQFIQYFTLIEAGLSGAAVFSLYKPLATNDSELIERILYSTKKMYSKIGNTFIVCVLGVSIVYPFFIAETSYSNLAVSAMFCLTGLNGATQLLFIGKYKVLLNASQNSRYVALLNSLSTCLYSLIIISASYCKLPLLVAMSLGAAACLVRALAFYIVARKLFPQYKFLHGETLYQFKNQKEVFIQQILSLLILNSSTLILSFSKTSMAEISVFTVYNMVLNAVFMITNSINTGVSAGFGDLIARGDSERLRNTYIEYEILFQTFWTVVFSCVSVLYRPFISLYTKKFVDTVYLRPTLCVLFSILGAIWVIRNQQSVIIVAAGKFKEIQKASIVEAVLTIALSSIGLFLMGLEGLLIGRIIAAFYRMINFIQFDAKEVLKYNSWFTFQQIIISISIVIVVYFMGNAVQQIFYIKSYFHWVGLACITVFISLTLSLMASWFINKRQIKSALHRIGKIRNMRK